MTNTIKFFTAEGIQLSSYALNGDTNVEGVCHDPSGDFFWTVEGTMVRQYVFNGTAFSNVYSFDVTSSLNVDSCTAICIVDDYLFIGVVFSVAHPDPKTYRGLAMFSKKGNYLKLFSAMTLLLYAGIITSTNDPQPYADLTYNGRYIASVHRDASTVDKFVLFDYINNAIVFSMTSERRWAGVAFHGRGYFNLQSSTSGQFKVTNHDGVVVWNGPNTVSTPRAMDYISDYDNSAVGENGKIIAIVHQ